MLNVNIPCMHCSYGCMGIAFRCEDFSRKFQGDLDALVDEHKYETFTKDWLRDSKDSKESLATVSWYRWREVFFLEKYLRHIGEKTTKTIHNITIVHCHIYNETIESDHFLQELVMATWLFRMVQWLRQGS